MHCDVYLFLTLSFLQLHPVPVLSIPLPAALPGGGQVDLRGLLPATLAAPTNPTLVCLTGCRNTVLPGVTYATQPGQVQILDLVRLGANGMVSTFCVLCSQPVTLLPQVPVTTRVQRPQAGDPAWQGRTLVAALAQEPGHWVSFVLANGVWWRVDSAGGGRVHQADPFNSQSDQLNIAFLGFKQ